MSWAGPALLVLVAGLALWRSRMQLGALALIFAVAAAAYAATGSPFSASAPASGPVLPERQQQLQASVEEQRARLAADPANMALWGGFSSALIEAGRSAEAVEALAFAAGQLPPSADMQVLLGTALLAHAEGVMTPAARLALGRASALDPQHPAPPYFLGLSYLQAGQPGEALRVWRELAARTPAGAPWSADLARKIRGAEAMQAAGVGGGA